MTANKSKNPRSEKKLQCHLNLSRLFSDPYILPKSPLVMLLLGVPYTALLNALNISARNSSRLRSVIGNWRKIDKSRFAQPSRLKTCRPKFPYVKVAGTPKARC